jgi:hypothetical protein
LDFSLGSALEGALYAVATITREQRLTIPLFYSILDQSKQQLQANDACKMRRKEGHEKASRGDGAAQ